MAAGSRRRYVAVMPPDSSPSAIAWSNEGGLSNPDKYVLIVKDYPIR